MDQSSVLFNLSFLENFTKRDMKKVKLYISTYLRTSQRIFTDMEVACSQQDWESVYLRAHSVKPQVQYMGITALFELIVEIENNAKENPIADKIESLVPKAMELYARSSEQLTSHLAQME